MRALYRLLMPAERFILDITLAAAAIDAVSLGIKGVGIDAASYCITNLAAAGLVALGLFYRKLARSQRIAAALICTGLFVGFSLWLATFNYLLMPIQRPLIDPFLAHLDHTLGYRWADAVGLAARHPEINQLLKWIYGSTLAQMAGLIVLLGLTGRTRDLHAMCVTTCIGAVLAVVWWGLFPSIGAAWLLPHPSPDILAAAKPLLGVEWGMEYHRIVREGVDFISPGDIQGLIAFPSFHTVMACVLIYFARNLGRIFLAVFAVNILMFPALLVHGSHHLVDIPGGLAVFFVALAFAHRIVGSEQNRDSTSDLVVPAVVSTR